MHARHYSNREVSLHSGKNRQGNAGRSTCHLRRVWDVHGLGRCLARGSRPLIAGLSGSAVSLHPSGWPARRGSCRPSPERTGSEAQVTCRLFPRPAPDGLIRVEVRAGPAHQPQPQPRRPQTHAQPRHGAPARCPRSRSIVRRGWTSEIHRTVR